MHKIWLSSPHLGVLEKKFVEDAFNTNWVAPLGPNVDGFENDIQEFLSGRYVAALSSGTAAIHLALILSGVKSGDEVICQSFTFSGSANPITYVGAKPVFVGSEPDTWNMSPAALREAVEDRIKRGIKPKAIIPVHLYGMPSKMDEINSIASEFEIPVIEDAAEALGSVYKGRYCGAIGNFGILSFNGNKIITTSGGGALIAKFKEPINKAKFLATQARDQAPHYQHSEIGYNYRMSNICAGIGRGQMAVLDQRVYSRRANFQFYKDQLGSLPGINFLDEPPGFLSNRWLTCVTIEPSLTGGVTSEKVRRKLDNENIESRPFWKPMHLQPVFSGSLYYGDTTEERLFENGLCLPSGSNLEIDDLNRICSSIKELF